MKTLNKTIFLLVLVALSVTAQSQNQKRYPQLRERILIAKMQEIKRSLDLDQATVNRLSPIYRQYEKEIEGIKIRGQERLMIINSDSLTAEEAESLVLTQLQNAKKLLDIREEYYYKFKTVLSPQQIIKLYQTEAEIRRKVMQELHRRFGGRVR
ncbi:MAG: hypothetical protein LLG13_14775 [Bacteroidales bacterium]|nr:hypothetical protein [Bacteroidales bacterium]